MKSRTKRSAELRALCAELHADDGMDPREAFSRETTRQHDGANRKTRQLCKQVALALGTALRGACGDDRLQAVEVDGVEPAPDGSRLRVLVRVPSDAGINGESDWLALLRRASGFLRAQLAESITRKRVPELDFALRPDDVEEHA